MDRIDECSCGKGFVIQCNDGPRLSAAGKERTGGDLVRR